MVLPEANGVYNNMTLEESEEAVWRLGSWWRGTQKNGVYLK